MPNLNYGKLSVKKFSFRIFEIYSSLEKKKTHTTYSTILIYVIYIRSAGARHFRGRNKKPNLKYQNISIT